MQTLLILGSEKAVDQFRSGAKAGPVVLGQDLSLGKKLGFDVIDDTNIFNSREVITHSTQDGHLVDWSLIGMLEPSCYSTGQSFANKMCQQMMSAKQELTCGGHGLDD